MKKLLFIIVLFSCLGYGQENKSIEQIYNSYVKGDSALSENLRKAIELIDENCVSTEKYDCEVIKVIAYYKLAERYFKLAEEVYYLDKSLYKQFELKAVELRKLANDIIPEEEMNERTVNALSYNRSSYYDALENNTD